MLSIPRLSLADAQVLMAGAKKESRRLKAPMCIAVVDESGGLIAFERMDGAKAVSVQLAQDKAFAAAVSRRPTHTYNERCVPGNPVNGIQNAFGGRFTIVGGGFPVEDQGGVVVGGIGCSSGTVDQDMACAQAGVRAVLKTLRKGLKPR